MLWAVRGACYAFFMKQPQAILFDLDGTLIDSMPLFRSSIEHALAPHGARLDSTYFSHWHGKRLPWKDLLLHHSIDLTHESVVSESSKAEFGRLLKEDIGWMKGAPELLARIRESGIPSGIVTTAFNSFIDAVDENLSIRNLLNVVITAEDVGEKSKPDPHGLFLACDALSVDPTHAIYVGDQPFDMLAANAAGASAWLVKHPHTPTDAKEYATHVFNDLNGVLAELSLVS